MMWQLIRVGELVRVLWKRRTSLAETLATKFCRSDVKEFGIIEGVNDYNYYENSFHFPSNKDVSPFDKIDHESNFPFVANGGHIS